MPDPTILRRIGTTPQQRGSATEVSCPDIFELDDGRYAVIGRLATRMHGLPADASVGPGEAIVVIPRAVLVAAKADIPDGDAS
jgi:hypothetical protein